MKIIKQGTNCVISGQNNAANLRQKLIHLQWSEYRVQEWMNKRMLKTDSNEEAEYCCVKAWDSFYRRSELERWVDELDRKERLKFARLNK